MTTEEELLAKLEDSTRDATRLQVEALESIIERQGGVRYLQRHLRCYDAPIDVATFRRVVPLSTYEDYSDDINRLADGPPDQDPLLSVDPLVCFFYSSGTSSLKPKLIPLFDSSLSKAATFIAQQTTSAILRRLFPPRTSVNNKVMPFLYADKVTITRGGFEVMSVSSYYLRRNANWSKLVPSSSPMDVILGSNVEHQMYCHLLCGLRNSEFIDAIHALYAIGLISAFSVLESKWNQLCDDLENGFLREEISDAAMRSSVAEVLGGPQVDLSMKVRSICQEKNWDGIVRKLWPNVRSICQEKNWDGIVRKLWPNVRYVKCVTTGSMEQYYPKLKQYLGDTPLLGGDYFASECCVGINLDITQPPESTRYVLLPTAAYFEFLPFDPDQIDDVSKETVDISGVEVGKMYEVVVTTFNGLYRYRLGDIVRVVGFHNSSPLVEYVMRAPKLLTDIITEGDLIFAIGKCQPVMRNETGIEIAEFASFLDSGSTPKRLKVLVEVREERMFVKEKLQESILVLRRICSVLEDNLGSLYRAKRDKGEVGSLLITIIKPGSFDKLSRVAFENGASASQYKPQKILRKHEFVSFLERSALASVCSDPIDN